MNGCSPELIVEERAGCPRPIKEHGDCWRCRNEGIPTLTRRSRRHDMGKRRAICVCIGRPARVKMKMAVDGDRLFLAGDCIVSLHPVTLLIRMARRSCAKGLK